MLESTASAVRDSKGDVEKRTGLLRCHISRVENGQTVPDVETLEKMARALEIPRYRLFTDEAHVKKPNIAAQHIPTRAVNTKQNREIQAFAKLFSRMDDTSRGLLFHMTTFRCPPHLLSYAKET
jgi:transcriptional regulator with XRE-family HTH domain